MIIPHREISPEALQGLIEDFVTREGTEYGDAETDLATKVAQVRRQLDDGRAVILYDGDEGSVTIMLRDRLPRNG